MAISTISMKITQKWWVVPLIRTACYAAVLVGKDRLSEGFKKWIAEHGFKIEPSK